MIRNCRELLEFERNLSKANKTNFKKNMMIFNALYKQAKSLKIVPLKNPLEGIEIKIKIARIINSV